MNILEAIVQLRDDIKIWVTNNLNALNSKIDEKTIPVDNELSNTSTNPVQNKVVSAQIDYIVDELLGGEKVSDTVDKAIASQKHFSGDYNDLTNAPNISEDGSGDMVIADESGNIIFKVDEEGVHTTDVEVDGTSLAAKIPIWDAKSDFSGNYNDLVGAPDIAEDGAGNMIVTDESGNIIAQVDENGFKTTIVQANQVKIGGQDVVEMIENHTIAIDDTLSDISTNPVQNKTIYNKLEELTDMKPVSEQIVTAIVNHKYDYNDLTNAPDIKEDGEGNMIIADEDGNIIFQVDAEGINTTAIKIANQNVLDIMDNKVAALVDSAPGTLDTLNELAAALGDDPNFATTVATQIGGKVDKVNGMGLSETSFTSAEKSKLANIEDGANKTVVDGALSDTSENPVQNKAVYTKLEELTGMEKVSDQIAVAIEKIVHPVTSVNGQTGAVVLQYEDIKNAPNIYEDSSNELVIADPDGNIIFRSDGAGFETTTLTAQTVKVGGSEITGVDSALSADSTNPVQNKVLAEAIGAINYPVTSVNGKTGAVVLSASDVGALPDTTQIPSINGLATQDYVDTKLDDLVGDDKVSKQIDDAIKNIDYPVDSINGKTGAVTLSASDIGALPDTTVIPSIDGLATQDYVDDAIAEHNHDDSYYQKNTIDVAMEALVDTVNKKVDSVNGKTGTVVLNYEDIKDAPNISEDNSGNLVIADPDGNIIFRSDGDGFETTTITAQEVIVDGDDIKEFVINKIAEAQLDGGEVDLSGYATVSYVDSNIKAVNDTLSQKSQVQIITWEADD